MAIYRETLAYRKCAGIMLLNQANKVFVGQRLDRTSNAWQMPQGGIEKNEEPLQAALRELKEEIGTNNIEVISEARNWLNYDIPDELIPKFWNGIYRGQTQKWFLAKFIGNEEEINLQTKEPEFSDYKWVTLDELPDIIVPFKRDLYLQVIAEFKEML